LSKNVSKITLSLAFMDKNRTLYLGVVKTFYIFCEYMETWDLAQTAINILEWSWDITDVIWNPFTSPEWILGTILWSPIRLRSTLILCFLWIVAIIWTAKDSGARSSSLWFQFLSVLLVVALGPVFGILLYVAIRPQWWKWDKTPWRDTSFQSIQVCDNCGNFNNIEHKYCTSCWESIQDTCRECQNKYPKCYAYCPHCGAPRLEE
jgi:hypothetical protein